MSIERRRLGLLRADRHWTVNYVPKILYNMSDMATARTETPSCALFFPSRSDSGGGGDKNLERTPAIYQPGEGRGRSQKKAPREKKKIRAKEYPGEFDNVEYPRRLWYM